MPPKKQQIPKFEVQNLYQGLPKKYQASAKLRQNMKGIIEQPFRLGVIGGSGSGKTNLIMNLLAFFGVFSEHSSMFQKVIYVCPTQQPLVKEAMEATDRVQWLQKLNDLPEVDNYCPPGPVLVVFDDLLSSNKKDSLFIERWFLKSRIKNVSCIYISQSYFGIPKTIRLQFSYLILKKINSIRTLTAVSTDFNDGTDLNWLKRAYKYANNKPNGFLFIDLTGSNPDKYRSGFEEILHPPEDS